MAESVLSEVKGSADEVVDSVLPQAESPVFEVFQLYRSTDWSRVVVLRRKGLDSSSPLTATPSPGGKNKKKLKMIFFNFKFLAPNSNAKKLNKNYLI